MRKEKIKKQNSKIMGKVKRKTSGITLIALVVTIVVLLILASISIGLLTGEDGIIAQAKNAKEETEISDEKEKVEISAVSAAGNDKWGTITEENLANELTKNIGTRDEDYTLSKEGESFLVTYTDSNRSYLVDANGNIIEAVKREGLKVGDYINYIPDENTEGYSASKLTADITGFNHTSPIPQAKQYVRDEEGMTWQILRIYADGSIDLIGSPAWAASLAFNGINPYNKGVILLNDICKTLYSNKKLNIEARSVNYEDLEYWLTDEGKTIRDSYSSYAGGPIYGHTQTYMSSSRYYPNLYAQEVGAKIDSGLSGLTAGVDKEQGNTIGLGISDEGTASGCTKASTSLTVTQTYWNGEINKHNFGEGYNALKTTSAYWIASRCIDCGSSYAYFGFFVVKNSSLNCSGIYQSRNLGASQNNLCIRPVVTLPSSVQIENCIGENSVDNMHKITQY